MRSLFIPILVLASCANPSLAQDPLPKSGTAAKAPRPTIEQAFAKVAASVVTIRTTERSVSPVVDGQVTTVSGVGSGVVIGEKGKILTAAHVVQTADLVRVYFADGRSARAEVLASDTRNDVALIRIQGKPPEKLSVATLGDSDEVPVGRRIFVVGAPRGISHTLTVGYVSARRDGEKLRGTPFETELFQTDAAINQGNSGGPMFDLDGRVIGIVSHIISRSGGDEGLGFAVTSNVAKRILLDGGHFWSGVDLLPVEGDLAEFLNVPDGHDALLVQRVARRSPAARLGLKGGLHVVKFGDQSFIGGGDVILSVQGIGLGERDALQRITKALRLREEGEDVVLEVLRKGRVLTLKQPLPRVGGR